jgi:hypothetical protein
MGEHAGVCKLIVGSLATVMKKSPRQNLPLFLAFAALVFGFCLRFVRA